MATSQASGVIQYLRRTALLRDGAGLSDEQLLTDYLNRRDEAAFEALVRRHGPMVWGVCRRVLCNSHDAEDAFQATFLVLVRKAAAIASRELLANWLYGVAHQTALKARATTARRKERERQMTPMPELAIVERDLWRDLQPLLDEELSRLPAKYRVVVVLCDLQRKTRKEAARQLGCPEGTVAGRLARARGMLGQRLARRGVVLSGGALAAVLSQNVASAGAPNSAVSATIKAASVYAAGQAVAAGVISAKVSALTEGVLKTMLVNKIKTASAVLLMIVLAGAGVRATAQFADVLSGRVGYQPPGLTPPSAMNNEGIITRPGEVALDANGGRNNPYFYSPPDPTNINHLWQLKQVGDYYMILPKVAEGKLALDANGGRNNPYFRHSDPTNINHLWKLVRVDACYLIVPKVRDGELALDANGTKGNPYFRKADATNDNHLWELRDVGDYRMIVPLVRRNIIASNPEKPFYQTPTSKQPKANAEPPSANKDQTKDKDKHVKGKDEKLRVLIDKVLAAHGGEEKLRKLDKFTETVDWMQNGDQVTGTGIKYFVHLPDHYRAEWRRGLDLACEDHIAILTKDGMKVWTNHHFGGKFEREKSDGSERPIEYYLDDVKFFGPRRVLRLKDADHRVALLDEVKIDGRPAVGVELTKTGPKFKVSLKMFFDKETNLLAKEENLLTTTSISYTDYKKFDGIPIAQKETAENAKDKTFTETKVFEFRAVEKLDAKLFEEL